MSLAIKKTKVAHIKFWHHQLETLDTFIYKCWNYLMQPNTERKYYTSVSCPCEFKRLRPFHLNRLAWQWLCCSIHSNKRVGQNINWLLSAILGSPWAYHNGVSYLPISHSNECHSALTAIIYFQKIIVQNDQL